MFLTFSTKWSLTSAPTGLQEGSGPDEPGPDPQADGAQPVRGGAGEDQLHGSRATDSPEGQASGVHPKRHAVHLQRPLHCGPAAHTHRAGEKSPDAFTALYQSVCSDLLLYLSSLL